MGHYLSRRVGQAEAPGEVSLAPDNQPEAACGCDQQRSQGLGCDKQKPATSGKEIALAGGRKNTPRKSDEDSELRRRIRNLEKCDEIQQRTNNVQERDNTNLEQRISELERAMNTPKRVPEAATNNKKRKGKPVSTKNKKARRDNYDEELGSKDTCKRSGCEKAVRTLKSGLCTKHLEEYHSQHPPRCGVCGNEVKRRWDDGKPCAKCAAKRRGGR